MIQSPRCCLKPPSTRRQYSPTGFRETVQQRLVLFDHKSEASTTVTVSASAVGTDHVQSEVDPRYVMVEAEAALLARR